MDIEVNKRRIVAEPETISKIRCYGCGKVFNEDMVKKYKNVLELNKLLQTVDRNKLEKNKYSNDELKIMGIKFMLNEEEPEDIHAKMMMFFEEYYFEPFDLIGETSEGMELKPYVNKHREFMRSIGVNRLCCRMHFQTPYLISPGLSNQITVPGLTTQFTEAVPIEKKAEDAINIMKGNIAEVPVKRKRAVKPKAEIIKPDEVPIQNTGMNAGNNEMDKEDLEAKRRDAAQQLMNMKEFIKEDEELNIPIEIVDIVSEELPMETPLEEKGAGRLVYPKEVAQINTKRGRGRPKKEK